MNEAEVRKQLDQMLGKRNWNVDNPAEVGIEFEMERRWGNISGPTAELYPDKEFADYLLYGRDRKPLAIIEAKRTSKNPRSGQTQADGYADNIKDEYGIDPLLLAIGGDSAGGNMSAWLAQKYRKDLRAQILLYPLMQMVDMKPPKPGPQDVFQLGVVALTFIKKHYVVDADVNSTKVSPLFEKNLKGLPPAYILTCGLDPLRAEGRLYKEYLEAAGVAVNYVHEKAMPHGFLNFSKAFPKAKKLPLDTGAFLRKTLKPRIS